MKFPSHAGNEFTSISKYIVYIALFFIFAYAGINVFNGTVNNPKYFFVIIFGAVLVIAPKMYVIIKLKKRISWGGKDMPNWMANIYRVGYWIMAVGFLITFV